MALLGTTRAVENGFWRAGLPLNHELLNLEGKLPATITQQGDVMNILFTNIIKSSDSYHALPWNLKNVLFFFFKVHAKEVKPFFFHHFLL